MTGGAILLRSQDLNLKQDWRIWCFMSGEHKYWCLPLDVYGTMCKVRLSHCPIDDPDLDDQCLHRAQEYSWTQCSVKHWYIFGTLCSTMELLHHYQLLPGNFSSSSQPTAMMKSQAAVEWQSQKGKQIHQGKRQNGRRAHSSTTALWSMWWEKQSCSMRVKAPLKTIKYSSAIRHRVLGSIPTTLSNKPPRNLLLKTTTAQSKTCCAALRHFFNYLWPLMLLYLFINSSSAQRNLLILWLQASQL